VSVCGYCGTVGVPGALFCAGCGRTLPQDALGTPPPPPTPAPPAGGPPVPYPPPPVGGPAVPSGIPPPPDWVPPGLVGRAVHCPNCNTLISATAVVCPVCLAALPPRSAAAAGGVAPAR